MSALENLILRLEFDRSSGRIISLGNKLTGEVYGISGDEFRIETDSFEVAQRDLTLHALTIDPGRMSVRYVGEKVDVDVLWSLGQDRHFAEKRIKITVREQCGLKRVILSRPTLTDEGLDIVCYQHPNFDRIAAHDPCGIRRASGLEPVRTFFGRTAKGGFFTGVEMPFDESLVNGNELVLSYALSLKVRANEAVACEPVYLGVYQRRLADARAGEWQPSDSPATKDEGKQKCAEAFLGAASAGFDASTIAPEDQPSPLASVSADARSPSLAVLALPSESAAMVAMTSAILGPRRHGFLAMACGWHCEMNQGEYADEAAVEADMRSVDFLAECGVDWLTDSHPWGGETEKMNALVDDKPYARSALVRKFLEHAKRRGIKVVMWPTMNNTHPWNPLGKPFRSDKPEWRRVINPPPDDRYITSFRKAEGNCLANEPFLAWLADINLQWLASGHYDAWCIDGDFWGSGGYFHSTVPVECLSDDHDHLPGDSNYACQRALDRLMTVVREKHPDIVIVMCRPAMDLGVWSQRNVEACFTLIETGTGKSNIAGGDEIRVASRIRVHHHFFPHYLDWPLVFPSYGNPNKKPEWPSEHIDYILISAMSCSPNLLMYLPTKTGIGDSDKAEIRRWLNWGRKNIEFLKVRRDLFDWPASGRVDGSAHFVGDRGIIFLFNPTPEARSVQFRLTEDEVGLKAKGVYEVVQEYPECTGTVRCDYGEVLNREVLGQSALILRVEPLEV